MAIMEKQEMQKLSPFMPFEDLNRGLTADRLEDYKDFVRQVIRSHDSIFEQKRDTLAAAAVNSLPYPPLSPEAHELIESGVICLISEGAAPYHPRYVAPDYARLLQNGSSFFELSPAQDLFDATASLLTAYKYVPSGGLPVFIGRLDELLEPYIDTVPADTARHLLKQFWLLVDRLNPSAFVHANLGPKETTVGRLLLDVDRELRTITNLTLRYDPQTTSDDFALQAVRNALELTKPYFLNHPMMLADWGEDYAIASCYNGMRLGGGIHTLVRINLQEAARLSDGSQEDLLERVLPHVVAKATEVTASRTAFLVEDIKWFEENTWIEEGLLSPDKFTAYTAIFGLAEAVNETLARSGEPDLRYGHAPEANLLADQIANRIGDLIRESSVPYCQGTAGHACYHAQVGISADVGVTPSSRVPSGEEPDLYAHLLAEAPTHRQLLGGTSTILEFDQTAAGNPRAVLDIIRGAHAQGTRNLSIGSADSEYVRVTGYLVRRADLEAKQHEKASRYSSAVLASGFMQTKPNHLHRRTRQV
jgi:YjjI family glycine radical enzyme